MNKIKLCIIANIFANAFNNAHWWQFKRKKLALKGLLMAYKDLTRVMFERYYSGDDSLKLAIFIKKHWQDYRDWSENHIKKIYEKF